jgi:hypothetical protein
MVTKAKTKTKSVATRKNSMPALSGAFAQQINRNKAAAVDTASNLIRVNAGQFVIDGVPTGNSLNAVILDYAFEHRYYEAAYDKDNISSPDCFALNQIEADLVPHDNSLIKQNADCATCRLNEFGSGTGESKACSNRIRVAVSPFVADTNKTLEEEVYILSLPPTSIKAFKSFINVTANQMSIPTAFVNTVISLELQGTYSSYHFDVDQPIKYTKAQLGKLESKIAEAGTLLLKPYESSGTKPSKKAAPKKKGSRLKRK